MNAELTRVEVSSYALLPKEDSPLAKIQASLLVVSSDLGHVTSNAAVVAESGDCEGDRNEGGSRYEVEGGGGRAGSDVYQSSWRSRGVHGGAEASGFGLCQCKCENLGNQRHWQCSVAWRLIKIGFSIRPTPLPASTRSH